MREGVKGHFRERGRVTGSHVTGNGCNRKSRDVVTWFALGNRWTKKQQDWFWTINILYYIHLLNTGGIALCNSGLTTQTSIGSEGGT